MPGGIGALESREFLLESYGLKNVTVKDYGKAGDPLPTGIKDDRAAIVIPEKEQFSITPGQKSILGTLVFCDLRISYGELSIYLDTVLIDVQRSKNIVKTELPGRPGSVKEYISASDYAITIRTMVIDPDGNFPEDQVRTMETLLNTPDAVEVINPLLEIFGIYNIVIEDWSCPSVEGVIATKTFELICISDEPIELINDDQTIG